MRARVFRKVLFRTVAVLLVTAGVAYAAGMDAFMGVWKLNESRSKLPAGAAKDSTVVYRIFGDRVTCMIDGTDITGQLLHNSWAGKFDGKFYPVTGDPTVDMRSYRLISSHILSAVEMKGGKVLGRARVVVSDDGKTRTVTVHNTDANGRTVTTIAVYDKQSVYGKQ